MSNVDNFSMDFSSSGVTPNYQTLPTDIKNIRPFFFSGSSIPKMYYDLKEQDKRQESKNKFL